MVAIKKRTRARELALQFLYQIDLLGEEVIPDMVSWHSTRPTARS